MLTADDHYFEKPPAEHFISLSSTRTALLNNAQWRGLQRRGALTHGSACVKSRSLPLHYLSHLFVCSGSAHLTGNLSLSQQQLSLCVSHPLHPPLFLKSLYSHRIGRDYICLNVLLGFCSSICDPFFASFPSWTGRSSTSGSVKVCRASWRCLLFHFSFQCHAAEQQQRSDKHRSSSIVCNLGNKQLHSVVLSNVSPVAPAGKRGLAGVKCFYYLLFTSEYEITNVCF